MSVKWGVMGTANIARGCTIPGMKMAENCELYAIAGRNEAKVQSYKDEFGFEKPKYEESSDTKSIRDAVKKDYGKDAYPEWQDSVRMVIYPDFNESINESSDDDFDARWEKKFGTDSGTVMSVEDFNEFMEEVINFE